MGRIQVSSTNPKNRGNFKHLISESEFFIILIILILFLCFSFPLYQFSMPVICKIENNQTYEENDEVILWMDESTEVYAYSCIGPREILINSCHKTLLEALQSHKLIFSGLVIEFKGNISQIGYCQIVLNEARLKNVINAVESQSQYQMYLDNFELKGDVGEKEENNGTVSYYIYTYKKLYFTYNDNHIVNVSLTGNLNKVKLTPGAHIHFTYGVSWQKNT